MRAALIVNPTKTKDAAGLRRTVAGHSDRRGWDAPLWLQTTRDDAGVEMARTSVREGVDLVLTFGGDGTVAAVATGLEGSGVPLGLLPAGTGNLLARNLGLPLDLAQACDVAFDGADRTIDLGAVDDQRFTVMAGLGFDAAMMQDAPETLKARVGWPAYVISGLRHLRDEDIVIGVQVDDGPRLSRRATSVLVGNVGTLQGGLRLLPDARPDDGLLDVVVLSPRGLVGWGRVALRVVTRRRDEDDQVRRYRGRRVEIRTTTAQPWQLDGDPGDPRRQLICTIVPGALVVRVPRET